MRIATRVSSAFSLRASLASVPRLLAIALIAAGSTATAATYSADARSEARTLTLSAPVDAKSVVDSVPTGTWTEADIRSPWNGLNAATSSSNAGAWSFPGIVSMSTFSSTRTDGRGMAESSIATRASARLTDSFIIQCGSCEDGAVGTLLFQVVFAAKFTPTAYASANGPRPIGVSRSEMAWNSTIDVRSTGLDTVSGAWPTSVSSETGRTHSIDGNFVERVDPIGPQGGRQTFALSFAFGRPIEFDLFADMRTNGFAASTGQESEFHYGGWLIGEAFAAWGGILSVRDSSGQLVDGFSAMSSQGLNYAQSFSDVVPEPGTWALMTLGVLALPLVVRRARRANTVAIG